MLNRKNKILVQITKYDNEVYEEVIFEHELLAFSVAEDIKELIVNNWDVR